MSNLRVGVKWNSQSPPGSKWLGFERIRLSLGPVLSADGNAAEEDKGKAK